MPDEVKGTPGETPTPQGDVAAMQTRITELEKEVNETKKGLSTAHKTLTEKDRQLKEAQETRDTLESLRMQMEVLKEYLPTRTQEAEDSDDAAPKVTQRKPIETRMAELEVQGKLRQIGELASEVESVADAAELDIETSPELKQVRRDFTKAGRTGDVRLAREALSKAKEITEGLKEKKVEDGSAPKANEASNVEELTKRIREEERQKFLKEYGIPEGGTPGSGGTGKLAVEQVKKMTPEEIVRNAKEIAKLPLTI